MANSFLFYFNLFPTISRLYIRDVISVKKLCGRVYNTQCSMTKVCPFRFSVGLETFGRNSPPASALPSTLGAAESPESRGGARAVLLLSFHSFQGSCSWKPAMSVAVIPGHSPFTLEAG